MSLVTYTSTHATASGVKYHNDGSETDFFDQPAKLFMSYSYSNTYDTNSYSNLDIKINVPSYFLTEAQSGTISWVGDIIHFDASFSVIGYIPNIMIDVNFPKGALIPGTIPSSLDGLEGITGNFFATVQPSVGFRDPGGFVAGQAISAPEPASIILFVLGIIGFFFIKRIIR